MTVSVIEVAEPGVTDSECGAGLCFSCGRPCAPVPDPGELDGRPVLYHSEGQVGCLASCLLCVAFHGLPDLNVEDFAGAVRRHASHAVAPGGGADDGGEGAQ